MTPLTLDCGTRICVVSAHLDDAAYSLGGWLASGIGDRVMIVTLFGISDFAPHEPQVHGDPNLATKLRREEELRFANCAGVESFVLDLPEAALRRRADPATLFVSPDEAASDSILADVEAALRAFVRAACPVHLFIPLAIGGHIDHWLARFAATRIAQELGCITTFFEDLPYAGHLTETASSVVLGVLAAGMKPFMLSSAGLDRKIDLLNGYASQVAAADIDDVARYFQRVGGERCWSTASSTPHLGEI